MGRPKKGTIKSPYFAKEKKKVTTKAEREKEALGIPFMDENAFPKELFVPSTSILSFGLDSQEVANAEIYNEQVNAVKGGYLYVAKYQLVYIKRYAAIRKAVEV
jgi:hypothetical protein